MHTVGAVRRLSAALAMSVGVLLFSPGETLGCDMQPLEEARNNLRRAANEAQLGKAREHAREAGASLERCAEAAIACGCLVPAEDFLVAASHANLATQGTTFSDFVSALHRATRIFNDAVTKLRACAAGAALDLSRRGLARYDGRQVNEPTKPAAAAQGEAGAPDQCTFLICARARRCQQPSNCLAGVIPVNPSYQPLYRSAREREDT